MSRSIHTTHHEYHREKQCDFSDDDELQRRLESIESDLGVKRRVKSRVRRERHRAGQFSLPLHEPSMPAVEVLDEGEWVHYPASLVDVQALLTRLPRGVLAGLERVRLCLGKDRAGELPPTDRRYAERDPWVGRLGYESLPGIHGGVYLGTYWASPPRIEVYAYVYEPTLPNRAMWELFLRLRMLATLAHEVAHHEDAMRRVARGRWRADDTRKSEAFAEETAAEWVDEIVVPYLESTYPAAVEELNDWMHKHGGAVIPLFLLGGQWRRDSSGRPAVVKFGSALSAFLSLARDLHEGESCPDRRLDFGRKLVYGGYYGEASQVIDRMLADDSADLAALTLRAEMFARTGDVVQAESLARQIVSRDPGCATAWVVLVDVFKSQGNWPQLAEVTSESLAALAADTWLRSWLLFDRGRANLELGRYDDAAADLDALSGMPEGKRLLDPLHAMLLLRTGRYAQTLDFIQSCSAQRNSFAAPIFAAARFEAARRLGEPDAGGILSDEVIDRLRAMHFGKWVDRLFAETAGGKSDADADMATRPARE